VFQLIGPDVLLDALSAALDGDSDDVTAQAANLLANLSNGFPERVGHILAHTRIMNTLRLCLVDVRVEVRRPAVSCVAQLIKSLREGRRIRELKELGLESTLRHLCEGPGLELASPRSPRAGVPVMGVETDREVRDKAREALFYLEHDMSDETAGPAY
jgi:armadillo repeat-containing protein 8